MCNAPQYHSYAFLQAIRAWANSKDSEYVFDILLSRCRLFVSVPFQDDMSDSVYFDMYLNESYLNEAKLLLHISNYYIISNCESCVYCVPPFGYLRCIITSVPSATVNRS